jgi:hypothetical protein
VQHAFGAFAVGFNEVFLLSDVGVGAGLMLFPIVHQFVGFFWIFVDLLAVDVGLRGEVVGGGFGFAQLGLQKDAVAVAVPWEIAGFMSSSHLINFIYWGFIYYTGKDHMFSDWLI